MFMMAVSSFVAAVTLVFLILILKIPAGARLKPEAELGNFEPFCSANLSHPNPNPPHNKSLF